MRKVNFLQFRAARWVIPIFGLALLAIAVMFFLNQQQTNTTDTTSTGIQITDNDSDADDYRSIIKNGKYVTSNARGISVTTLNSFNAQSFENSINLVSKRYFSPNNFIFQEGQYLSAETITSWLGRYSDSNTDGLNPVDNGRTDNGRSPIYLQSIIEDDFVVQESETKVTLKGITIGMAMNRQDSYTKEQYGSVYTQDISHDEMVVQGKQIAAKILERLRNDKKIGNKIPILLVMYENSPTDDITGGVPYAYSYSKSNTKIGSWNDVNISNIVFPMQATADQTIGGSDNNRFVNFQSAINNFFPTITTSTAQGRYENGILTGLKVTVNTAFYSTSELKALTNYIATIIPSYFSDSIPITVTINGSNVPLAIISQKADQQPVTTFLFSY